MSAICDLPSRQDVPQTRQWPPPARQRSQIQTGKLPNGTSPIFIPVSTRPKSRAICKRWMPTASRLKRITRAGWRKALPATMAALARRGGQALRGDRRSRRPARLLCRPRSCRRQRRSRHLQILWRRFRAADGGLAAFAVLRARTQPHRRCRDRARDADAELADYRPWIEDLRKDKPYQLEDRVEQLFHEKSQSGCRLERLFDQTISGLRFKVGARSWRSSRRSTCCRTARRKSARPGQALAKTFKDNERTFALITNTLAKDKEISDRWRGFQDVGICAT